VLGPPEYAELEKQDRRAALTYRNDLIGHVVASRPALEIFERAQALVPDQRVAPIDQALRIVSPPSTGMIAPVM
jgi:hypothetical protein